MNSEKPKCEEAGLYVHIPFCDAKCRYCGFYSEPIKNHDPNRLVSAIITELGRYDSWHGLEARENTANGSTSSPSRAKSREMAMLPKTVYIGGGSPSCLPESQIHRLISEINSQWPKPEEFTIEVNPGQVNKDILGRLRTAGVTRISIGAQSFNADELTFLGRRHSVANICQAVKATKDAGFENIGLDLIFAIPGSTLESWKCSLWSAIELDIQHISAYALTYEEGTPLQRAVAAGEVMPVEEEIDRAMYEMAIDELEGAGFKQYEISNFARPGFECRHNLNYWANKPYIGVGPAAGSYWQGKRTLNVADITKYIESIEKSADVETESEMPDKLQIACETAVLNLRRRCGIDLKEFESRTGFDALELFAEPIGRFRESGLIESDGGRLFLTRKALPIADSVLCDFSDV